MFSGQSWVHSVLMVGSKQSILTEKTKIMALHGAHSIHPKLLNVIIVIILIVIIVINLIVIIFNFT